MSLIAELRRRNVIRMAGLYLVGAWLVVQVAGTVLPMFEVPGWVARAVVILLALGFVPALVFAWVFELTPEGLKRDGDVPPEASIASTTGRRMDRLLLVGAVAVILVLVVERMWPTAAPVTTVLEGATGVHDAARADGAASGPTAASQASIAVLPFENMSADLENGYFADGISEELLNVLAGIDGLTVASRTSSFTFKGTKTAVPEIARQLGVQHVLEGSVRKQGNRVRITAQLIRAGTDVHLWSQTYDRDLTDIFKVQEEIAQAISDELIGLLPLASKVAVPASTADLEAYEHFLRGRSRFYQRSEMQAGLEDLKFAVARDPNLGEAWAFLAATQYVLPGHAESVDFASALADAEVSLAQARRLAPDHPLVPAIEGMILVDNNDYLAGLTLLERAASLRSTDSTPAFWHGLTLELAGYSAESVQALERAQRIDPLSGIIHGYLSTALFSIGEEARGKQEALRAAELGWSAGAFVYMVELARRGDVDGAVEMAQVENDPKFVAEAKQMEAALRDPAKGAALLDSLPDGEVAEALLVFGQEDRLLDAWLQHIRKTGHLGNSKWALRSVWMPSAGNVREDPRFFEIASRAGLVKLWEARVYPPGCTRVAAATGDHLRCAAKPR